MSAYTAGIIILIVVLGEYYYLKHDVKRWGWMKNWSNFQRNVFTTLIMGTTILFYIVISLKYL